MGRVLERVELTGLVQAREGEVGAMGGRNVLDEAYIEVCQTLGPCKLSRLDWHAITDTLKVFAKGVGLVTEGVSMERQTAGLQLHIPEPVVWAIRLPGEGMAQRLLEELAVALYARGLLSFGKARKLADVGKYEFGQLLGEQNIPRHYGQEELEDDLAYARSE